MPKIERLGGRCLLAWEPGLGKSFEALWYAERNIAGSVVVVCPAVVKISWAREAERHFGRPATVLYGRKPFPLRRNRAIYVINYDILWSRTRRRQWLDELKRLAPELVVLDEVHYIKEGKNRRSRACKELCDAAPHVLGLSGTPVLSRPVELWFPLRVINPKLFPSLWFYGMEFCSGHRGQWGWDFSGASNLERLYRVLTDQDKGVMVRRRKEDVLKDLPPKTRTMLPVQLPKRGAREYREAVDDFLNWLRKKSVRRALRALTAEGMMKVGYLKRLAAQHKLPMVIDWVRDFLADGERKLIVFGVHNAVLRDGVYEEFKQQAVLVNGAVRGEARQAAIDRFNNDPSCRLFVSNIVAGGVGWSCTSCDDVMFAELDWTPGAHVQAEERVRGIARGTGRPVSSYWMVAEDTLEEALCKRLQKKSNVVAGVLDGKAEGDLQTFKFLIEVLEKQRKKVRA